MRKSFFTHLLNNCNRGFASKRAAWLTASVAVGICCFAAAAMASRADSAPGPNGQISANLPEVKIADGVLQGTTQPGGIRAFLGVPYAQPPINALRWREPQPVIPWSGVRVANAFGLRPMQLHPYPDQRFRSLGMSEDCLYLNVWTPTASSDAHLPVLFYIYGGGYVTGSGDEQRYDGASMARKGIVVVTMNYRLGIFGFLAHPALTAESPHHASGNYGLLDQVAALKWVHDNIAAFGGDAKKVTIGGESAGSFSVSALMASPLSKNLFAQASGESGSVLGLRPTTTLAAAEQDGAKFAAGIGAPTLAALRAIPADKLMQLVPTGADDPDSAPLVDGYFLPKDPAAIYAVGQQAHVPLLAGWNSAEVGYDGLLKGASPTPDALNAAIAARYGADAPQIEAAYSASTPQEAAYAARDFASDQFIAYGTWNWIDTQERTGGKPVYRYLYAHPLPPPTNQTAAPALNNSGHLPDAAPIIPDGAPHASDIAYALGNVGNYDYFAWQPADYTVAQSFSDYYANFIKTGNPDGPGLPAWPSLQTPPPMVMHIDVTPQAEPEMHRDRYLALKAVAQKAH